VDCKPLGCHIEMTETAGDPLAHYAVAVVSPPSRAWPLSWHRPRIAGQALLSWLFFLPHSIRQCLIHELIPGTNPRPEEVESNVKSSYFARGKMSPVRSCNIWDQSACSGDERHRVQRSGSNARRMIFSSSVSYLGIEVHSFTNQRLNELRPDAHGCPSLKSSLASKTFGLFSAHLLYLDSPRAYDKREKIRC